MGFVVLPVKIHCARLQQRLKNPYVLPQMAKRRGKVQAHALHSRPVARAYPQAKTPGRQLRHDLRLLCHDQRVAGIGGHNGRPQFDALRA